MENIRLFCLPCAGGSSQMYSGWKKYLNECIILHNVELSGRGTRFGSDLYNCFNDAVDDVYNSIKDYLDKGPYAFFGHSMGGWLVYELACKIKEEHHTSPAHIFIAAQEAPHILQDRHFFLHKLPMNSFKNEIIKLGGIPKELCENKEIFDFYLPIIKSDYKITENYVWRERKDKLDRDFTVLYGNKDNIEIDKVLKWCELTEKESKTYSFDGGHFFIVEYVEKVTDLINYRLVNNIN